MVALYEKLLFMDEIICPVNSTNALQIQGTSRILY